MDLGTELRNGRERRGISLAVLAGTTKIGVATLQAMERGDFGRLPGGIFTRGFLRAYAREVGLDPELMVQQYLAEFEPSLPTKPTAPGSDPGERDLGPVEMEELERRSQRKQLVAGAVVLMLGPFLYFTFLGRHSGANRSAAHQTPPPAAVTHANDEVGTTGSPEQTSIASLDLGRQAGGLHLQIQPTGACWVSAIADGRQGLQHLMTAGEREEVSATDEVLLRVGDPSTCAFSINGAVAHFAGKAGQPATLHITRQNYKDFLNTAFPAAVRGAPPTRPTTSLPVKDSSGRPSIPAQD